MVFKKKIDTNVPMSPERFQSVGREVIYVGWKGRSISLYKIFD